MLKESFRLTCSVNRALFFEQLMLMKLHSNCNNTLMLNVHYFYGLRKYIVTVLEVIFNCNNSLMLNKHFFIMMNFNKCQLNL